nr:MAG TPA: hypothetical protein [Bacteriophage sp.]
MIVNYITLILRIQYPTVNIQLSMFKIAAQGIEPCQIKPCQPLSNLQFLITEGFSVSNNTTTIHKSPLPELLQ